MERPYLRYNVVVSDIWQDPLTWTVLAVVSPLKISKEFMGVHYVEVVFVVWRNVSAEMPTSHHAVV